MKDFARMTDQPVMEIEKIENIVKFIVKQITYPHFTNISLPIFHTIQEQRCGTSAFINRRNCSLWKHIADIYVEVIYI